MVDQRKQRTDEKSLYLLPFFRIILIVDVVKRRFAPDIMKSNVTPGTDDGAQNRQVSASGKDNLVIY